MRQKSIKAYQQFPRNHQPGAKMQHCCPQRPTRSTSTWTGAAFRTLSAACWHCANAMVAELTAENAALRQQLVEPSARQ
jgi:hypothetical protein